MRDLRLKLSTQQTKEGEAQAATGERRGWIRKEGVRRKPRKSGTQASSDRRQRKSGTETEGDGRSCCGHGHADVGGRGATEGKGGDGGQDGGALKAAPRAQAVDDS